MLKQESLILLLLGLFFGLMGIVYWVWSGEDGGGVGELRDPLGADVAGGLDGREARGGQGVDEVELDLGGDL